MLCCALVRCSFLPSCWAPTHVPVYLPLPALPSLPKVEFSAITSTAVPACLHCTLHTATVQFSCAWATRAQPTVWRNAGYTEMYIHVPTSACLSACSRSLVCGYKDAVVWIRWDEPLSGTVGQTTSQSGRRGAVGKINKKVAMRKKGAGAMCCPLAPWQLKEEWLC